jgi:hypothetical protein
MIANRCSLVQNQLPLNRPLVALQHALSPSTLVEGGHGGRDTLFLAYTACDRRGRCLFLQSERLDL